VGLYIYKHGNEARYNDAIMVLFFFCDHGFFFFFFFDNLGCPDQLTYTTTNPRTH
jgi:hypothetical protein